MKIILVGLVILATLLAAVQGQCPGRPWSPACYPPRNNGHGGHGCHARRMWWYEHATNTCKVFWYGGCGGNRNRWCSKADCDHNCHRGG